jgi:hypothetical protein
VGSAVIRQKKLTAQLRDVALVVLVRLTGQQPADYGFPYLQAVPGLKTLPSPDRLGFAGDPDREAALKKWKEWSAGQKR